MATSARDGRNWKGSELFSFLKLSIRMTRNAVQTPLRSKPSVPVSAGMAIKRVASQASEAAQHAVIRLATVSSGACRRLRPLISENAPRHRKASAAIE